MAGQVTSQNRNDRWADRTCPKAVLRLACGLTRCNGGRLWQASSSPPSLRSTCSGAARAAGSWHRSWPRPGWCTSARQWRHWPVSGRGRTARPCSVGCLSPLGEQGRGALPGRVLFRLGQPTRGGHCDRDRAQLIGAQKVMDPACWIPALWLPGPAGFALRQLSCSGNRAGRGITSAGSDQTVNGRSVCAGD